MMKNKIMRVIIHPHHEFPAIINYCGPVAPGQHSGKEPGYLYILFLRKCVWYADGVFFNKRRLIVKFDLAIKKNFYALNIFHCPDMGG